jgi:transcriptional regulator with XRE-family HTH domain
MSDETSFGRWLQRRRKARDLTQGELARRVGCAVETLRKIEADARRPSRQIAERLADALELPKVEGAAFVRAARGELTVDRLAHPTQHVSEGAFVAAAALPRGTITFLFTDIEGSTQLWEQHPVAMREALAHHDVLGGRRAL